MASQIRIGLLLATSLFCSDCWAAAFISTALPYVECHLRQFTHPSHGVMLCSEACHASKTGEQIQFCADNCPNFYTECGTDNLTQPLDSTASITEMPLYQLQIFTSVAEAVEPHRHRSSSLGFYIAITVCVVGSVLLSLLCIVHRRSNCHKTQQQKHHSQQEANRVSSEKLIVPTIVVTADDNYSNDSVFDERETKLVTIAPECQYVSH
jgi:hypothetical protein